MKRIVYAAPANLESGAAHNVHILRMCEALTDQGCETFLIVKKAPEFEILKRDFDLSTDFKIKKANFGNHFFSSTLFSIAVFKLTRKADTVLTRSIPVALLMTLLRRKTILELHSPPDTIRSKLLFRMLFLHSQLIGFVVITEALAAKFVELFGEYLWTRMHVLPDGAVPRSRKSPKHACCESSPVVGYVGSFLPGKGVQLVIEIARLLPAVKFELVGGTEKEIGMAPASVPANIKFVGRIPHAEAIKRIESFNLVLLPNQRSVLVGQAKTDIGRWTSPLKLFEYMAASKTIIASRLSVLCEVLDEGRNCAMADPENPSEWATKIQELIVDTAKSQELAQAAERDFRRLYTWRLRAKRIVAIVSGTAGIVQDEIGPQ